MKKPKPKLKAVYSASEIHKYLKSKNIVDNEFWEWFFSECPWGESNLLGFDEEDEYWGFPIYVKAIQALKLDLEDGDGLRIENDLSFEASKMPSPKRAAEKKAAKKKSKSG